MSAAFAIAHLTQLTRMLEEDLFAALYRGDGDGGPRGWNHPFYRPDTIGSARLIIRSADRIAAAVEHLVQIGRLDARSEAADALLDYADLNIHRGCLHLESFKTDLPDASGKRFRPKSRFAPAPTHLVDEHVARLRERFNIDALERLARAEEPYYSKHGHYVPELATLLLAEYALAEGNPDA